MKMFEDESFKFILFLKNFIGLLGISLGYQVFHWVTKYFIGLPGISLGYQVFHQVTRYFIGLPGISLGISLLLSFVILFKQGVLSLRFRCLI